MYLSMYINLCGFRDSSVGKQSFCSVETPWDSWVGKIRCKRERLPTPVFWPGESHGLYSARGRRDSDTAERHFMLHLIIPPGTPPLPQPPAHAWHTLLTAPRDLQCVCMPSRVNSATPGTLPSRLLCPRESPGKNAGVGCHFLLQRIFPTRESNSRLLHLLHWQMDSLPLVAPGKPTPFLTGSLTTTGVGLQLYEFEINYVSFSSE